MNIIDYCSEGNRMKYNMKKSKLFSCVICCNPIEKARE